MKALVRWATGKTLTNRLPKLSLITAAGRGMICPVSEFFPSGPHNNNTRQLGRDNKKTTYISIFNWAYKKEEFPRLTKAFLIWVAESNRDFYTAQRAAGMLCTRIPVTLWSSLHEILLCTGGVDYYNSLPIVEAARRGVLPTAGPMACDRLWVISWHQQQKYCHTRSPHCFSLAINRGGFWWRDGERVPASRRRACAVGWPMGYDSS